MGKGTEADRARKETEEGGGYREGGRRGRGNSEGYGQKMTTIALFVRMSVKEELGSGGIKADVSQQQDRGPIQFSVSPTHDSG